MECNTRTYVLYSPEPDLAQHMHYRQVEAGGNNFVQLHDTAVRSYCQIDPPGAPLLLVLLQLPRVAPSSARWGDVATALGGVKAAALERQLCGNHSGFFQLNGHIGKQQQDIPVVPY